MMARGVVMFFYLLSSLAVFFLPNMIDRRILFGVVVPEGFRESLEGRSAIRTFRIAVGICALAGVLALALLRGQWLTAAVVAGPLGTVAAAYVTFVQLNRRLKRFAAPVSPIRQMELSAQPERLPRIVWLGVIPILLLPAIAAYLRMHWDSIPARFPVHWGINGQPNRWVYRSVLGVFGPLVLGGELTVWLFVFALACWYGTRRSEPLRKPSVVLMIMVECFLGIMFSGVALLPLSGTERLGLGGLSVALAGVAFAAAGVAYMVRKVNESRAPLDPTPAECWKGGMIYYNPNDAALFVARRDAFGLTLNLANPWSWLMAGSLPILVASGFLVLR